MKLPPGGTNSHSLRSNIFELPPDPMKNVKPAARNFLQRLTDVVNPAYANGQKMSVPGKLAYAVLSFETDVALAAQGIVPDDLLVPMYEGDTLPYSDNDPFVATANRLIEEAQSILSLNTNIDDLPGEHLRQYIGLRRRVRDMVEKM